jgi:Fe-S cluster assembly protein SufD
VRAITESWNMTQALTRYPKYAAHFQALESRGEASSPTWLGQFRERAWSRFAELGLPIARRGNEKWKYTDIRPIANASFEYPLDLDPNAGADPAEVKQVAPWQEDWANLVFVDGCYSSALSTASSNGVRLGSLADAISVHGDVVEKHLAQYAGFEDDGFIALNTAFIRDGAFIHIPYGQSAPAVVNLVFITTGREQPRVTYPRTLVLAGRNTRLTVLESYVSLADAKFFTNAVTEIVLEDGANVEHYRLLLESAEAFHVGVSRVYQGRDSAFTSASFTKGAALGRNDFQVLLDGPGASCTLNGLYFTTDTQHMDNFINIDHAKPYGSSRLYYKGILDGHSKAVFGGTVVVRKDAQKTDAQQTDKNLLLSDDAEVDSKPSLLIYADDVKCGHGATAGHIDENTLFYMRSRGLDLETASRILIHAFASEIINTVQLEPLREYLDRLFTQAIPTSTLRVGGAA